MIITRTWLQEWIDIKEISTEEICKALNSIGLEVDSYTKFSIPKKVVLGYVKSRTPHTNSDHLSVCEVDIGDEILQIVCGAKNVAANQFVAVALIGCELPNGLIIKPAKLRGVESNGMICSATELGLPKINDGILVFDSSIGELKLGKEICEFECLNDEVIEIELTPNRGDCLSVRGVARDLAGYFNLTLKENVYIEKDGLLGIGRIISIHCDEKIDANFQFRAFCLTNEFKADLLTKIRLAFSDETQENPIDEIIYYATLSTGVLFRAYDFEKIITQDTEKIKIEIKKGENGEIQLICDNKNLSIGGILQNPEFKANSLSQNIILEASYFDLNLITDIVAKNKISSTDYQYYRASRGSEPNLSLGCDFLFNFFSTNSSIKLYSGFQQILNEKEPKIISTNICQLSKMIGKEIELNEAVKILKQLNFEATTEGEILNIKVPNFRHDIDNSHDICEEIVRIIGIDNIPSKPLIFSEKNRLNENFDFYKNSRNLRIKSANCGFFECVHYVFDNLDELQKLDFKPCKIEILNPINNELNSLRPILINSLLNSAERNFKNSKKSIKLFEFGSVFDENGEQSQNLSFIASGFKNDSGLNFGAKQQMVDFLYFANLIQNIIGKFEIVKIEKYSFLSPFEQAQIWQNGQCVGFIGRVHKNIENQKDLPKSYICEIWFDKLKFERILAKNYSKFQLVSRDLSIVIPTNLEFSKIKKCIENLHLQDLKEFSPIDIYKDENFKNECSLTMKFIFQNDTKTLEEEEISELMEKIIEALKQEFGINLR